MNRPDYKEYLSDYEYEHDLEKYCDELEKKLEVLEILHHRLKGYKTSSEIPNSILMLDLEKLKDDEFYKIKEWYERSKQ